MCFIFPFQPAGMDWPAMRHERSFYLPIFITYWFHGAMSLVNEFWDIRQRTERRKFPFFLCFFTYASIHFVLIQREKSVGEGTDNVARAMFYMTRLNFRFQSPEVVLQRFAWFLTWQCCAFCDMLYKKALCVFRRTILIYKSITRL